MDIKINMLNVNDGDAIIVHLKKSEKEHLVILIDGGRAGNANKIINVLDTLLKSLGKEGPDLVICTHYDLDHIGGLQVIAEHFKEKIEELWIHKPNLVEETVNYARLLTEQKQLNDGTDDELKSFRSAVLAYSGADQYMDIVLEQYNDMVALVKYLSDIKVKIKEPFPGLQFPGWPEIKVLGPTMIFYDSKLDQLKPKQILLEEIKNLVKESNMENERELAISIKSNLSACQILDNKDKSGVTAANQVSAIIEITVEGKKYLFTGDANIDSFINIPDYKTKLKNIYWLKVAHHGSNNNSNSELIGIMSPKYAYISGRTHFDPEVQRCLEDKGAIVKLTSRDGDLEFPLN